MRNTTASDNFECSLSNALNLKTYMGNSAWEGKKLPGYYPGEIVGGKILDNWDNSAPNWRTFMASVWDLTCTGECPNGSDASKQIPAPVSFKCDENSTQEGVPVVEEPAAAGGARGAAHHDGPAVVSV